MTPLPPIDDPACLRCEFRISDGGSVDAGSRFYISYSSDAPSGGSLTTLAGVVATAWGAHLAASTSTAEYLATVVLQDMASDLGAEGTHTGDTAGTMSGNQLPSSACAVVNHQIARRYRGGRPRTYLRAGTTTAFNGTNQFSADFVAQVLSGWEAFIAAILADTTSGITLVNIQCVSYYNGSTWTGPDGGPYKRIPTKRTVPEVNSITGSDVATKIGSQRRRLNLG